MSLRIAARVVLPLFFFAALGCNALTAGVSATQAPAAAAYTGQFDCYGHEKGSLAYSGRVTLQPGGVVTFKDYDGGLQTGAWTNGAQANTLTFSGSLPLASATYIPASDALSVAAAPGATVTHAEGGSMYCQRAVPGKTGPP